MKPVSILFERSVFGETQDCTSAKSSIFLRYMDFFLIF